MKAGWETKKLEEVCTLRNGRAYKKPELLENGKYRVLRVGNFFTNNHWYFSDLELDDTKYCAAGDLLYAWSASFGPRIWEGEKAIYHYHIWRVDFDEERINKKFLYYWFSWDSESIKKEQGAGTTMVHVSMKSMNSRFIDIPPLKEQQRIVAILDEAFAGIATATANAEKNLQNARELFESSLQSVFAEKGEGWKMVQVKDVASHCLGKMLDKNKNKGDFKPYLRNLNVRWFDFNLDDMLEMRFLPEEAERYTAIKGDLMVCEGGYPGRAAIWEKDEPICFQKAIHRVRFEQPEYAKWLLYYLYLSDAIGDLRKYFTGAGIQHFTGKALGSVVFPMPPLSATREKLRLLDSLMEKAKTLEGIYEQKLHELEELKQSLLQKAFAGELH